MQHIVVGIIVAVATLYLIYYAYRKLSGKNRNCCGDETLCDSSECRFCQESDNCKIKQYRTK